MAEAEEKIPEVTVTLEETEGSIHSEVGSEQRRMSLEEKLEKLTDIVMGMTPVFAKLSTRDDPTDEVLRKPVVTPEIQRERWDGRKRNPTFTEMAGSLAFHSPDTTIDEVRRRRETIFEEAGNLEKGAMQPTFRRNVPAFKHELHTLRFSDITRFFNELYAYQSEHNAYERACPHLHWSVRSMLMPKGISDPIFMQIPNGELFALIRKTIAPATPQEFRNFFVQGLKFNIRENFELKDSTFREWCSMIKVYFREVQSRFDFLAEDLPQEIIPDLVDRDNGLITLVLQRMVPFDTSKYIHDAFYSQFKRSNKWFTLAEYLEAFQSQANEYIQKARDSQALSAAITIKPKYWTNSAEKPNYNAEKSNYYAKNGYSQQKKSDTPGYGNNGNSMHNSNSKTLQFVDSENGFSEFGDFGRQEAPKSHTDNSDDDGKVKCDESDVNLTTFGSSDVENERNSLMAFAAETHQPLKPMVKINPPAMGASRRLYVPGEKKSPGDFPCIRWVIDGKCPFLNDCKNSHDEGRCREYYFQILKKLQYESPVRPPPQSKQEVSMLCEEQRTYLMSLSKNVDVVKIVFCTGLVYVNKTSISVYKILLDSGALHGNYISLTFLHEHGDMLYGLMEDADETIFLADQSKSCHVSKKLKLVLKINSGIDGCYDVTFCSTFSVLPGLKHDIIIGLPTLVTDLVNIFVARISSLGTSANISAIDAMHEVMVVEKGLKKSKASKKKLDFNPEASPISSTGAKRQYLHDSLNPSLAEVIKKKFIPSEEFKGNYPDGDLEEIDFPPLPVESPAKHFKLPRVLKTRVITPLKEGRLLKAVRISEERRAFLPISTTVDSIPEDDWHTGDTPSTESTTTSRVNFADQDGVELTCPLYIAQVPKAIPYARVPFTECNDYRERLPAFRAKLIAFQIYLSQIDHSRRATWYRSEPLLQHQQQMLTECVHPDGVYCAVSTMLNLDEEFPRHSLQWETVRNYQYACRFCRDRRWYAPLSLHKSHDCPFLQRNFLESAYRLSDWSGVLCPPGWENTAVITNTGPYIRFCLDRDPNAWMYWFRPAVIDLDESILLVNNRTEEVLNFQRSLCDKDVIPHHLKYGVVNPMLADTPIPEMNEPTYCRIEMAHNEAQCSTAILPTVLKLDELFPGHSISLQQILDYLLSCNKCKLMCYNHWESEGTQPYLMDTLLKTTDEETAEVFHHLASIEMWRNPNDDSDDDLEPDDDWYSSDTQDSFLDFDEECQFTAIIDNVESRNPDMPSLACSQPVDPTSGLETNHLQGGTPEEISIDPYKLDINIDNEGSLSSDDYSATQGYHESYEPLEYKPHDRLAMVKWREQGKANDELAKLRREEFLEKWGNLKDHELAPMTERVAEPMHSTETKNHMKEGDLAKPWSHDFLDEEAPEDLETPQPSNFDVPLAYMNKSLAEATSDFFNMIVTRVSAELGNATNVVENLKTKYLPVFVPHNWLGITGISPVVIEVTPDIPLSRKPKARPVNPKMMGHVFKEFTRLSGYFYVPSTSPWASCLVIAAKKTEPFCRFCGDYREINKYIKARHSPIPNVANEILRISSYKIFADLDMKTSFHQLPLAEASRQYLSIQTPWGQVEPLYVPEGSKPASGALQDIVRLLFGHLDYVIAIFDNLLVLANTVLELEARLYAVLDICLAHNVVLGFAKCNIGVKEVEFFGYVCSHKEYKLSKTRKDSVTSLPFPRNQKEVQQVMGTANMFLRFTPNYSMIAKDITDMSAKAFNWDESTWTVDHRASYERFKEAIANALTLYYPDYNLNWILRTDASLTGCGVILYQEYVAPDGILQEQVIAILSHKFSGPATRWPTIEQEAFAIYFGVRKLEYLLMCKSFVVETDHRNLVWMETSLVAKIIRWRIYLQGFNMTIRHIKGKDNVTADWLSRIHSLSVEESSDLPVEVDITLKSLDTSDFATCTPKECFNKVHGGRMGHPGTARTLKLLSKYFPTHGMSQEVVSNMVAQCPHCQKIRLGVDSRLVPMHRTLSQTHLHAAIGCDTLTVSPADALGNKYIVVIVNLFSKYTALYPVTNHDAKSLASALFQYYCTYGVAEMIVSDPGSDLTSEVIRHLHHWFGIRHQFSLVERHQSNGVEGTNKTILRHLRSLVHDERLIKKWGDPTVLPLIQYMINCEFTSSESGIIPLHAHFGNKDQVFQRLPSISDPEIIYNDYIQILSDNVALVREVSKTYQSKVALQRTSDHPEEHRTVFQPGDYVLKRLEHRPSKLMFQLSGPFKVLSQHKNDVQVRSLVYDNILTFHIDHLKIFVGTHEAACAMARLDKDQYLIKTIQGYRGDPKLRSSCSFKVHFEDNDVVWVPWSPDISITTQFEEFCRTRPELYQLLFSAAEATKMQAAINRTNITEVQPGMTAFVNLRFFGSDWYQSLGLPNSDETNYVVVFIYQRWYHKTTKTKIVAICNIFSEEWPVNHAFVRDYGSQLRLLPGDIIVNARLIQQYPQLVANVKPNMNQFKYEEFEHR